MAAVMHPWRFVTGAEERQKAAKSTFDSDVDSSDADSDFGNESYGSESTIQLCGDRAVRSCTQVTKALQV